MKKRYLTLFPSTENIHLIKDVGMIPYVLYKEYGYDSTIAHFNNGEYPYLKCEVDGLKQSIINRYFRSEFLNVCVFILINFRRYDILQCFHATKRSFIYLLLFKILKLLTLSRSITYLKLDMNDPEKRDGLGVITVMLLKTISVISVESYSLSDYLNKPKILNGRVNYIPNGFFEFGECQTVNCLSKKKLIITVARIGCYQKNTEVLLEAFRDFVKVNRDWKLELIGPVDVGFTDYIKNYFIENPELVSKVVFSGNITDRDLLSEKYKSAKIFALTSRWESFGIVLVEAMSKGCFILSTNFGAAFDITDNEKYGRLFQPGDVSALTKLLHFSANNEQMLNDICTEAQIYAYSNFSWKKICGDINQLIVSKMY